MKIGRITIKATGWPWQIKNHSALLDFDTKVKVGERWGWKDPGGMGRFGGGWRWKLGVMASGRTVIFDLVFGSIRISREMA